MDHEKPTKDPLMTSKIVGAVCVAGLVFLFGRWGAEALTTRGIPDQHHGDEHAEGEETLNQAYIIEVASSGGDAEEEKGPDFGALMHDADVAKGEKLFGKCKSCHSLEPGKNGTGPSLAGIIDRQPGTEPGYTYSAAMQQVTEPWTPEHLFTFLADPKGVVPGTKMSFAGIKDPQDRADLVAFLMGPEYNPDDFSAAPMEEPAEGDDMAEGEMEAEAAPAALVGDVAAGEKVYKKCKACHSVEPGKNGTGPSLFGVVGRQAGTEPGYNYSAAMRESGILWTNDELNRYLTDVKGTVPGTKMTFAGIKDEQQRADVISYLDTLK